MPAVVHRQWASPYLAPGPIYLDSTILLGWSRSKDRLHARAVQFIGDHLTQQIPLQVSLLGLDEMMWVLLRDLVAQARSLPPHSVRLAPLLKQNPALLAAHAPNLRSAVGHVLAWTMLTDPTATEGDILDSWLDRMSDIGGPHDAWHLGLAERFGARSLATGDTDFRRVTNLPFALQIVEL